MAENEYLDSTKARRWRAVAEGLRDGCDTEELTERVRNQFYKSLRHVQKEIPQFADMLDAVDKPDVLHGICNSVVGAVDVKDAMLEAAFEGTNRAGKIESFLGNALESCLYDLPVLAAEMGEDGNLSDRRIKLRNVRDALAPDLLRIAGKLAVNPNWAPRLPPAAKSLANPVDKTRTMLSESLISGFRK